MHLSLLAPTSDGPGRVYNVSSFWARESDADEWNNVVSIVAPESDGGAHVGPHYAHLVSPNIDGEEAVISYISSCWNAEIEWA